MLAATTTCHTTTARPISSHPFPSGSSAPLASATAPPTADATAADLRGALRPVLTVTPADQTSGFADHYGSHTLATLPLARTLVTGFSVDRAASFISADEEPAPSCSTPGPNSSTISATSTARSRRRPRSIGYSRLLLG